MKKLNYVLLMVFLLSFATMFGQNANIPKRIVERCAQLKTMAVAELKLTGDEAAKYEQIMLDKLSKDAVEIKKLDNEDAKKEYRKASNKELMKNLIEAFGFNRAKEIHKWTSATMKELNEKKILKR